MKQENGSAQAIQNDENLKKYENTKVVNYIKQFRRFADKNPQHKHKGTCSEPNKARRNSDPFDNRF